jgi:hypothetical protein
MSPFALRLIEHIHGHLAWLSTVALYHPAWMLRRTRRGGLSVTTAATALITATALLGAWLYPPYRTQIKPLIFAASNAFGNAFERKEHLAVCAVVLAWTGLVAHWAAAREPAAESALCRLAQVAFALAAAMATVTAGLGLAVAVARSF